MIEAQDSVEAARSRGIEWYAGVPCSFLTPFINYRGLGNLAILGAYGGANLTHLVLDNEAHDSTGAQSTVSNGIDFAGIAESCGYGVAAAGDHLGVIEALFAAEAHGRARLAQIKIRTGTREDLPRPALSPIQVLDRLMAHIGTAFS